MFGPIDGRRCALGECRAGRARSRRLISRLRRRRQRGGALHAIVLARNYFTKKLKGAATVSNIVNQSVSLLLQKIHNTGKIYRRRSHIVEDCKSKTPVQCKRKKKVLIDMLIIIQIKAKKSLHLKELAKSSIQSRVKGNIKVPAPI